jgi:hypothetical protein
MTPRTLSVVAAMVLSRPRTLKVYTLEDEEEWEISMLTLAQAIITVPLVLALLASMSGAM